MIVTFKTAKLAKEVGFDLPTLQSFAQEDCTIGIDVWDKGDVVINYPADCYLGERRYSDVVEEAGYKKDGSYGDSVPAPTQSELNKYIRENRGVNISVYPNASSWLWSFTEVDERGFGGTDLGWCGDTESGFSGPNLSGGWDSYEEAMENALQVQLSYSREEWEKERKGHIRGYAAEAIKKHKEIKI